MCLCLTCACTDPPYLEPVPALTHHISNLCLQVLSLTSGQTLELKTGDLADTVYKVTFCVTLVHATP